MPTAAFTAQATSRSETCLDVKVRDFALTIDEPVALGGTDEGPNPVEMVLAALLGCMNVVVHLVAKERGVTIRSLGAEARGTLDPSRFLGEPTEERAGFAGIEVVLTIDADASAEQIEEIVRAAEGRCPVSDNLVGLTPVTINATATG